MRNDRYSKAVELKIINVALVGNPNCGKTTIFNFASGAHERVGNYSGVTVEAKEARFRQNGYIFNVVDLPGTYSISAYSPEELFVRDYILDNSPDVVVNVVDSSNLQRNLYLTTELIDMGVNLVIALNMYDELLDKGDKFDYNKLGKLLGVPFIPTVGSRGTGIRELFDKIINIYEEQMGLRKTGINYGKYLNTAITEIESQIVDSGLNGHISPRFMAVKLLEKDLAIKKYIKKLDNSENILQESSKQISDLEVTLKEDSETLITDAKYGYIAGALKETFKPGIGDKIRKSEIIDTLITHKVWGIPIFLGFLWFMFYITFNLGEYPMNWIESGVEWLSTIFSSLLPNGIIKDFLIHGLIGGVGGVLVFLPNIILLYFFISLMQDTGYMARAVFIMDKAMHKIGLHGKSFIPLLMGFGCNVPAIMSSRIIESRRDRLVTMLINPFMSCSARLAVYVLLISAFFVEYQATVLFSLYMIGVMLAIISALIFKKTLFKTEDIPFVMELPPYRMPTAKSILRHVKFSAMQYLKKIGGVILLASTVIWALGYFPLNVEYSKDYDAIGKHVNKMFGLLIDRAKTEDHRKALAEERDNQLYKLQLQKKSEKQEQSYIGSIGRLIQPVMKPLGFDWKMTVAAITGLAAKEVVVGTMGVLYHAEDKNDSHASLIKKLQDQTFKSGPESGRKVFTPLVAFSFMVFILIYFPCIGVVAAIKKESGSWKWSLFSVVYTTSLAWLISLAVYQVGSLFYS